MSELEALRKDNASEAKALLERMKAEKHELTKQLNWEKEKTEGLTCKLQSMLGNISEMSNQLGVQKDLHSQHEQEVCTLKEQIRDM